MRTANSNCAVAGSDSIGFKFTESDSPTNDERVA